VKRGAAFLLTVAGLAVATACTQQGKLDIRSRPTAIAAGDRSTSERIAEARGQFALGNVALALEAFRKAARENPQSVDALTGMAACYDAMGRFELSRTKYEEALAIAPTDASLLRLLASSLQQQGKFAEAAQVQAEAMTLAGKPPAASAAPSVAPAGTEQSMQVAGDALAPPLTQVPDPAGQIAALIPPSPSQPLAPNAPVRLERISMAEVALVTTHRRQPVATAAAATIALPALQMVEPGSVRILNAARIDRLAARTRDWLKQRGWPELAIADAGGARSDSVIFYPAGKLALAQRLSFELGFATVEQKSAREVTVVLGRDVARDAPSLTGALAVSSTPSLTLTAGGAPSAAWAGVVRPASHAIAAGRPDQARAMIARAVTAGAPPLVTSRLVADLTYSTGDYATAAGLYEALIKVWRDDALMVERAGLARLHLGHFGAAARHLAQATNAKGASWQAWNAQGVAADARRDWAAADTAYRHALMVAPRRGEILNNAGWSMALRGRWSEAHDLFQQAVTLDPRLERASRNLELARTALDQQLPERGPQDSENAWAAKLNDAGVVAQKQGNWRKAVAAFARAIETRSQWFERAVNNLRLAERKD
jgi:Flp pilus assembly protein TadD